MKTRRLGNSDLNISVVGLGTFALGGGDWSFGWGDQNDKDSIEAILEALENGVNWIDTAPIYGHGRSEQVVGKALHEWGKPVIIATKCGVLPKNDGSGNRFISKKTILEEIDGSLQRLGVDCVDLYQIHWPSPDENIEEAFEALLQLKEQGKIRWPAVSNFSVEQLERCSALGPITSLQPPYSLLRRDIEEDILPWCGQNNCGVIVYGPMFYGLLTGKVTPEWAASLPANDWRNAGKGNWTAPYLKEPALSHFIAFVDKLKGIAFAGDHTVGQLAINWVLARKEVTAAIVGARKKGQIAETARAAEWELSQDELKAIDAAYQEFAQQMA